MDPREKAKNAPYHLVTSLGECLLERFWVVQLDCGIEVYQSEENPDYDEPNSWMRLKRFCEDTGCRPVNMARAGKDLNPHTQINLDPKADGYYYSRRLRKLMAANPGYSGYQDHAQGVGQLFGDLLQIMWEMDNGQIEIEERKLGDHPKSNNISLIRK